MSFENLSKEQQIMVTMRKVLTTIIREITPQSGKEYPLSDQTVEDIRLCLRLIAAREQELAKQEGITNLARPQYADDPQNTQAVPLYQIQPSKKVH